MLASNLLRISVIFILVGMAVGIGMGMTQDFRLAPAHAHLNLLGYVLLFLAGLYYHVAPDAAATGLARTQAFLAVIGAIILPVGIGATVLYGPSYEILPIIGSLVVFLGMILFALIVFRHGLKPRM